jgi:hypothetical protein
MLSYARTTVHQFRLAPARSHSNPYSPRTSAGPAPNIGPYPLPSLCAAHGTDGCNSRGRGFACSCSWITTQVIESLALLPALLTPPGNDQHPHKHAADKITGDMHMRSWHMHNQSLEACARIYTIAIFAQAADIPCLKKLSSKSTQTQHMRPVPLPAESAVRPAASVDVRHQHLTVRLQSSCGSSGGQPMAGQLPLPHWVMAALNVKTAGSQTGISSAELTAVKGVRLSCVVLLGVTA